MAKIVDENLFLSNRYKWDIFAVDSKIIIHELSANPLHKYIETILDTKDKLVQDKLTEIGWTPPESIKRICGTCKHKNKCRINQDIYFKKYDTVDNNGEEFIKKLNNLSCAAWE